MAERSKAAVSKTVNGFFPFGGSNPPLSAIFMLKNGGFAPFFPKSIIRVAQSVLAPKEGKVGRHGQLAEQEKV